MASRTEKASGVSDDGAKWDTAGSAANAKSVVSPSALIQLTTSHSAGLCEAAPSEDRGAIHRNRSHSASLLADLVLQKLDPTHWSKHIPERDSLECLDQPMHL